ncbi:MAG: hypothetical protein M5U01_32725 [Ardenticatenaceae bacterium]|nr:hypothetical protein [Ardenticatenaceae bacterium]
MKYTLWSLALALLLLPGCRNTQPAPEPTTPPRRTATATAPPALATLPAQTPEGSSYPAPGIAGSSYPAPEGTATGDASMTGSYPAPGAAAAEAAPAACPVAADQRFATLLQHQPGVSQTLGCPASEPTQTAAAWQVFEHDNQMVWLKSEDAILALHDGQWQGFEDTFEESDPTFPPTAPTPPAKNLILPRRGFGKVWVTMIDTMGYGVSEEAGYDATVQRFEKGWLVTTPYGQVLLLEGLTDAQHGGGRYQAWLERDGKWERG